MAGPKDPQVVIVGIDAHTHSLTAAAVDEQGRELATVTVGAHPLISRLRWL